MNKMLIGASVIALATLFGASSTLAIAGDKKGEPQGMVEVEHGEHKAKGHDKHDKMDKMDKKAAQAEKAGEAAAKKMDEKNIPK
ncbi:MAG: hypothetical protein ACOY4D_01375 [Pseudomonadota bacterium]